MSTVARLQRIAFGLMTASVAAVAAIALLGADQAAANGGSIRGWVMGDLGVPLAGATVTLRGGNVASEALTNEQGEFQFALPNGAYLVSASRPGYVSVLFGAKARGRPGVPIDVRLGSTKTIELQLVRGAAISGSVFDELGLPLAGAEVVAVEPIAVDGRTLFGRAGSAIADDRGAYRVFGLAASGYYLVVLPPESGSGSGRPPDWILPIEVPSDEGWDGQDVRESARARAGRDLAPYLYPGTHSPREAALIKLRAGEQRADVDLRVTRRATSEVMGRVLGPDGRVPSATQITLVFDASIYSAVGAPRTRSTVATNGTYSFRGLVEGSYTVVGRAAAGRLTNVSRVTPADVDLVGTHEFSVVAQQFLGLPTLRLSPGALVRGRVSTRDRGVMAGATVRLSASGPQGDSFVTTARVQPDGAFVLTGVPPGRYMLEASIGSAAGRGSDWHVSSVKVGTRTLAEPSILLGLEEAVSDVSIELDDGVGQLDGAIVDPRGRPMSDVYVMIFTSSSELWTKPSRVLRRPIRPSDEGRYRFSGLPPGEYYLAALRDYDENEWFRGDVLRSIVPSTVRLVLRRGERRTQDIRVTWQ